MVTGLVRTDRTGPPERRFDLLVLADGFAVDRFPQFVAAYAGLRRELYATAPFGTLRGLVNLARAVSSERLVTGATLSDHRMLVLDEDAAWSVARSVDPDTDAVLVVVDSPAYAGVSGHLVAAVTCHEQAPRVALHELGHAVFGLADEYEGPGSAPGASGPGEPAAPNLSLVGDPALVKWRDLVTADGSVGCYEGADRVSTGVYRPSPRCLMRSVHDPFCPVCRMAITRTLVSFRHARPLWC